MSPIGAQYGMIDPIVSSISPVTILGGADLGMDELNISISAAPIIVAADSGADHALVAGHDVAAVIGDLDSVSDAAKAAFADRIHFVDEPDTTDFEKVLARVHAPLFLACGFLGGRLDHTLAVLNVLIRFRKKRIILLSDDDVVFVCPPVLHLTLPLACRFALLPMGAAHVRTRGLRWDLDDAVLDPVGLVSSSNEVAAPAVQISAGGPVLITLPLAQLGSAIAAVHAG